MANAITGSGVVTNSAVLEGKYVAGRDIIISERKEARQKVRFTEVNTAPYEEDKYIVPKFRNRVLDTLKNEKVIIIGGSYEFDKNSFARHLAVKIINERPDLISRELIHYTDNLSVFSSILAEEPSVLIFTDISPLSINYDLNRLRKIVRAHDHYAIITTNLPKKSWKLNEGINYWFEVPDEDIYHTKDLLDLLLIGLERLREQKKIKNIPQSLSVDSILVDKFTVKNVAEQLTTVARIGLFLEYLSKRGEVTTNTIEKIISQILVDKAELINQWFYSLDDKGKELVLILILLDGLYDDQFFIVVEKILDNAWNKRKVNISYALDYHDLDVLLNFYRFYVIDEEKRQVKSRFSNQRSILLKTIWFSHRRQMLSCLPILVNLAVVDDKKNYELYGSEDRIDRLYDVISNTLSELGRHSINSIERVLISLASSEDINIQKIVASALARLREFQKEEELFDILYEWQEKSRVTEIVKDILESRYTKRKRTLTPDAFLRSTIALTLGFAAQYDKPNQLDPKLLKVFRQFSKETNEFVRERFRLLTIPQFSKTHLLQLKNDLLILIEYNDFIQPIAWGIAEAYDDSPNDVNTVLNEWLSYCLNNTSERTKNRSVGISKRDKILFTIILALGDIKYDTRNILNSENAYNIISDLQQNEYRYPFKELYVEFIDKQIRIHKSKVDLGILKLIENISVEKRHKIIEILVNIYIDQRQKLKEGEDFILHGSNRYPIWIDGTRPCTEIEETMFKWIDSNSKIGQQIALEALYNCATVFEVKEDELIQERKRAKEKEFIAFDTNNETFRTEMEPSFFAKQLKNWTLRKYSKKSGKIIFNLLITITHNSLHKKSNLRLVSKKMLQQQGDLFQDIAQYLKKYPAYRNNYNLLKYTLSIAAVFVLLMCLIFIM